MKNSSEAEYVLHYPTELEKKMADLSNTLQNEVQCTINKHFESWREDQITSNSKKSFNYFSYGSKPPKRSIISESSPERKIQSRIFIARPSILTELLAVDHIKGIYNMFIATLCIMFIHEIVQEIVSTGSVRLDLSMMNYSCGKFDEVLLVILYMDLITIFCVYSLFYLWSHWRWSAPTLFDVIGLCVYVAYLAKFLHLPLQSIIQHQLPPTSSFIILCEQTRLAMKTWAFVRTNVTRAKKYQCSNSDVIACPGFSNYVYFLFAPTLVYRDEYPRNISCNWNKVFTYFAQVAGSILYANFLFTKFLLPVMRRIGKEEYSKSQLIVAIFSCCFPAALLFLLGFFLLLHCWMNAFAEMLRFADRMFYKDWWNSTSYSMFYRTWNCIVHDWLYEYVYKEICELHKTIGISFNTGRYFATVTVFFTSAVVHECILAFTFRFFYPVLLLLFGGIGTALMFLNTNSSNFNIFFWFSHIIGHGILFCLYFIEWYARFDCAPVTNDMWDFFVPRSWFCQSIIS